MPQLTGNESYKPKFMDENTWTNELGDRILKIEFNHVIPSHFEPMYEIWINVSPKEGFTKSSLNSAKSFVNKKRCVKTKWIASHE